MADAQHDIDTLSTLLTTVVDSVDGFEQASEGVESAQIKSVFAEVVAERRQIEGELERQIRALGGQPEERGSILASAHRVLIKLRDAISSGDAGVVAEAERGEDYIKGKFEKAEEDEKLSVATRETVRGLAQRVVAGHNRIRDLKHALQG